MGTRQARGAIKTPVTLRRVEEGTRGDFEGPRARGCAPRTARDPKATVRGDCFVAIRFAAPVDFSLLLFAGEDQHHLFGPLRATFHMPILRHVFGVDQVPFG